MLGFVRMPPFMGLGHVSLAGSGTDAAEVVPDCADVSFSSKVSMHTPSSKLC